jgi:hypothetical protein
MQTTSLNQLGLNRLNSQYRQQLHLVRPTSHHSLTALIHNRHHVLSPDSLKNPAPISHLLVGHDFRIFSTSLLLQDTICMEGVLRVLERVPTIRIADQLRRCRVTGLSKHPNKGANPPRHKLCSTRAPGPRLVKWREWVWLKWLKLHARCYPTRLRSRTRVGRQLMRLCDGVIRPLRISILFSKTRKIRLRTLGPIICPRRKMRLWNFELSIA